MTNKKINKLINEKFIIYNTKISIEDKIKENLSDYQMNYTTMNYLINVCSNDNERILNELEKLKMYKLEEKEITSIDIDKTVIKNLDDNIFSLTDAVLNNNKVLVGEGKNIDNIAGILDVHSYRVKLESLILHGFTFKLLLTYLENVG